MEGAPSSSSSSSFLGGTSSLVILSVSIVGILSTALLLLAYYLFLTRCGLLFFWRADLDLQDDHVSVTVQEQPPRRSGRGLEEAAIRRIPTFRYRHSNYDAAAANSKKQLVQECAVCLGDFCAGERLRLLPPCRHAFHIDCIDAWLHATASCPLCRAPVVDGPAADDIVVDIAAAAAATPEAAEQPAPSNDRSSSLPLRRSLSMDSSTDKRRFYLALQRVIQQQQDRSSSRRLRRSFFSFSHSRGSRSAILPL
ncbi:unnamed protein product [Urochloa decumbens]|uniref:RING-type E3 ubiquitin transferase n=1 Tax=Urochloa decumbens TaxID=240449 RepID=A0ABC9C3F4_9POAL